MTAERDRSAYHAQYYRRPEVKERERRKQAEIRKRRTPEERAARSAAGVVWQRRMRRRKRVLERYWRWRERRELADYFGGNGHADHKKDDR